MNIEIGEKFLPIGTVVMLKGGTKKVMITGFCSVSQDDDNKMYDYSGCIYPEGYVSFNQICLFDHDQIGTVFFKGYIDDEEKTFKDKLIQLVSSVNIQGGDQITTSVQTTDIPPVPEEVPVTDIPVENIPTVPEAIPVTDIPVENIPTVPEAIPVTDIPVGNIPAVPETIPVTDIPVENIPAVPEAIPSTDIPVENIPTVPEVVPMNNDFINNVTGQQ